MSDTNKNIQRDEQFNDVGQQFRELLLNGKVEEAGALQADEMIPDNVVNLHAKEAFAVLKETEQFDVALHVAIKYFSSDDEVNTVKIAEWNRLNKKKQFVEAAEWALSQGLSEKEIYQSGLSAFEKYLEEGNVEEALKIVQKYKLRKESLISLTMVAFNKIISEEDYYSAARLGKAFNLSKDRTTSVVIKACNEFIKNGEIEMIYKLIDEFELLNDTTIGEFSGKDAENLVIELTEKFIRPSFDQGKLQLMKEFAEAIKLNSQQFENSFLKEFVRRFYKIAVSTHNSYLNSNDLKSARFIRDSFNLFVTPLPFDEFTSLVESSEAYHKSLLENAELNAAIAFKKEYEIFTKFTVEKSKKTAIEHGKLFLVKAIENKSIPMAMSGIKEYNVTNELVDDAFLTGILHHIHDKSFDDAFALRDELKFKPTSEAGKARIIEAFKKIMQDKDYIHAVEFAHRFNLQRSYELDAAIKAWQVEFIAKRHDNAINLNNKFKINKEFTLPLAKRAYREFNIAKDYPMAILIRRAYKIPIGIIEWILEFFRLLFSR